jgi:aryl-alcohol dehydrogenase-like predicted oxidoreductase
MKYRRFGRTGWQVSEIGYGMWAMGGQWAGSDDNESVRSLARAQELGCNFFDTAWAYGEGRSEKLFRRLMREHPRRNIYVATKVPPKNRVWPASPKHKLDDTFPPDHIREYAEKSLHNLGVPAIDLLQLHVWDDSWAKDERWQRAVDDLKRQKVIRAFGISVNRWEPANVLAALGTGLVDAVQVIYNIFDQSPEDALFPYCKEKDIAVIARVPFDEGSLTGKLTKTSKFDNDDWRSRYFGPENLMPSVIRVNRLKPLIPAGSNLPRMALKFILSNPIVSTTIPGMRKISHVEENITASDGAGLPGPLLEELKKQRWDRHPTSWSA